MTKTERIAEVYDIARSAGMPLAVEPEVAIAAEDAGFLVDVCGARLLLGDGRVFTLTPDIADRLVQRGRYAPVQAALFGQA